MYNTHPHISTQEVRISAKTAMSDRITLRNWHLPYCAACNG